MSICFGYDSRPHRGDRFSCRPDFSAGGSYTHFELDTWMVHAFSVMVHVPLDQMVRC
jgi:hypothetical protein